MTKQTIEVEGLPDGYALKEVFIPAYRTSELTEDTLGATFSCVITLEKIKPRRIVLEETVEGKHDVAFHDDSGCWTYWHKVTETEDPKLSLSVDDCKSIIDMSWGWELLDRLKEFIKENS